MAKDKVTIKDAVLRGLGTGFIILAIFATMQFSGCEPAADLEVRRTPEPAVPVSEPCEPATDLEITRTVPEPLDYWHVKRSRILDLPIYDPDFQPELPDFKVTDISKEPADNPARAAEYDYFVRYELPNGKTAGVIIRRDPLTVELMREAIREHLRFNLWVYRNIR